MSTRKNNKPRARRATIPQTYTEQTRAIARRIDRAEENNVLDMRLAARQEKIAALAIWDAIHAGTPDYIMTAIINSLDAAAKSKDLPLPTFADDATETRAQAIEKIGDILTIASHYKPADPNSPAALAQAIAAVVKHPLTPVGLYNAIADELTNLEDSLDHNSPEYLERALIAYTAEQQEVHVNG